MLPAPAARWLNVFAGAVYVAVMVAAIRGEWHFYVFFGLLEIVLLISVVVVAIRWPRALASEDEV